MHLDPEQIQAIQHTGSPLLVTAGPGSGKTFVIIERIKFLINSGLNPSEILCLTFSEKAAAQIKDRLEKDPDIKGKIDISDLHVSTYHSFCSMILKENSMLTGITGKGGIIDRAVFIVWGVQNIDSFGFDDHIEIGQNGIELIQKMIEGISVFNDELILPEELEKYVNDRLQNPAKMVDVEEVEYVHLMNNLVKIYKEYVKFKKEKDIMDFDDLIVQTNSILGDKSKPHVLNLVQNRYKHILIDEFQDNNFAQFSVVKKLVKDGNVTAVGDGDQNIYRFQGSYTEIFEDFKKSFPGFTEIKLLKNHRNPLNVINLSNQLLAADQFRIPKTIIPVKNDIQKVNVVECSSEFAQAEFIKNKIIELVENHNHTLSDFAILSRKQKNGLNVAKILANYGIPTKFFGKSEIHNSANVKVLFSYLRIISDPMNSMSSIVRILQEYGISEQNISKINFEANIRARVQKNGDYCYDVISDCNVNGLTQLNQIKEIFSLISEFIEFSKDHLPSQTIYHIMRNKTDIYKKIANDDSISNFIERSLLNDILESAYDFEKINNQTTIKEFLKFAEELQKFDVETGSEVRDENAVHISTIHKSKGLEFKTVFIVDVAQLIVPLNYSEKPFYVPRELSKGVLPPSDPKQEFTREERRVLYVGMTRTSENLFVMYPTKYESRSRTNKASKFLESLDPKNNEDVNFISYDSSSNQNIASTFDPVENLKSEQMAQVLKNLHSEQFGSAIQKILNMAKIKHFQINKSIDDFSFDEILNQTPEEEIEDRIKGAEPNKIGFSDNLSFTKLDTYDRCHKKFWYSYVLKALPANQEAAALYKGSTFHDIVEDSSNRQKAGIIDDFSVLSNELDKRWDSTKYLTSPVQKEEQDRKSLTPALESYHKWTKQNPNEIMEVEREFTVQISNWKIDGKIDRIEKTPDGEYVVIDYKTGNAKDIDAENSLQLNLYAYALKNDKQFGKYPKKSKFFYVEKPEGEQFYEYDVSDDKVKETIAKIEELIKLIEEKDFVANPAFHCKWCQYSDICDEAKK